LAHANVLTGNAACFSLGEPLEVTMGPLTSDPSSGSIHAFPPPTRHAALNDVHDEHDAAESWEWEEEELASIPRPINWYAIVCRILGLAIVGCAIWGVWELGQHPQARAAMIEWVTFGKAH
jgi:hypothetical protein